MLENDQARIVEHTIEYYAWPGGAVFDDAESRASSMRVIVPSENTLQAACSALQERRELVEVL